MSAILGNIDPWIAKSVSEALTFSERNDPLITNYEKARQSKLVQVLRVKFPMSANAPPPHFVVSDGQNSVAVFLSSKLYSSSWHHDGNAPFLDGMPSLYRNISKGSLITIRQWYITTTVECAGTKLSTLCQNNNYIGSICFCINQHVQDKGCAGIDIIGEPENVNIHTDVQRAIQSLTSHTSLTKQLQNCETTIQHMVSQPKHKVHPSFEHMSTEEMQTTFTKVIQLATTQKQTITTKEKATANPASNLLTVDPKLQPDIPKTGLSRIDNHEDEKEESSQQLNDNHSISQRSSQTSGESTESMTKQKTQTTTPRNNEQIDNNQKETQQKMTEIDDYFSESDESNDKQNMDRKREKVSSFFEHIDDLLIPCTQEMTPTQQECASTDGSNDEDEDNKSESIDITSAHTPMSWPRTNDPPKETTGHDSNKLSITSSQSTEQTKNTAISSIINLDNEEFYDAKEEESKSSYQTKKTAKMPHSKIQHDMQRKYCHDETLPQKNGSKVQDFEWSSFVTIPYGETNGITNNSQKSFGSQIPTQLNKKRKIASQNHANQNASTTSQSIILDEFRRLKRKKRTDLSALALASNSKLPPKDVKKQILMKQLLIHGAWFSRRN